MKLRRNIVVLILAWASCLACAQPAKRALLVGIDDYNKPIRDGVVKLGSSGRIISDLQACVNDVTAMREILTKGGWGFTISESDVLLNQAASRQTILDALDRLARESNPGDTVLFYYSGHGSRIENPESGEQDKMDETLVPADAVLGVNDIRDKELAVKFNALLAAVTESGNLTIILDSCHSGSATRDPGLGGWNKQASPGRWTGPIPKSPTKAPWENGALVIAAARDDEEALEDRSRKPKRAAFSGALTDVMNETQTGLSAMELVELARARMKVNRKFTQEPIVEALEARKRKGLFGEIAGDFKGVRVPVAMGEKDEVRISGGLALGIRKGCQLGKPLAGGKRLVVEVLDGATLSDSKGKIVEGTSADLKSGEVLEVTRWTGPDEPFLRVWAPPAVSEAELKALASQLSAAHARGAFDWADEPPKNPVTHVLNARGKAWTVTDLATGGESPAGAELAVSMQAGRSAHKPRVLATLPPTKDLLDRIGVGKLGESDVVVWVATPSEADYYLIGRPEGDRIEYCWALPPTRAPAARDTALERDQALVGTNLNTLPEKTRWFAPSDAETLGEYALRLGRIRAWLTLQAAPDTQRFPYRLALRRADDPTGAGDGLITQGVVYGGEKFNLVLHADPAVIAQAKGLERRHVYVFAIDGSGEGIPLFPRQAGEENRYPISRSADPADPIKFDPTIVLPIYPDDTIYITEPFGTDTFVLLTTSEPIDLRLLEFAGVRKGVGTSRGNPLAGLLDRQNSGARGAGAATVPTGWSIYRLVLESREKKGG